MIDIVVLLPQRWWEQLLTPVVWLLAGVEILGMIVEEDARDDQKGAEPGHERDWVAEHQHRKPDKRRSLNGVGHTVRDR